MSNYSLNFNESRKVWIAKFKKVDGSWGTKFLSKSFKRQDEIQAERELIGWLAGYQAAGTAPKSSQSSDLTIRLLAQRWIDLRYADVNTARNTYKGLRDAMQNWILNNPKFPHHPIEHLEVTQELTVAQVKTWIDSVRGMPATKIDKLNALKTFFNDCIGMEWLDPNMANPIDKPAIKKIIKGLQKNRLENQVIAHLNEQQVNVLLTQPHQWVTDYRRIRYLLTITSGLRDHEVQGLCWSDIDWKTGTLSVSRQLAKIGVLPMLLEKDLVGSMSKDAIMKLPNAIGSKPKSLTSKRIVPLHSLTLAALKHWLEKGWRTYVGRAPTKADPIFARGNYGRLDIGNPGDFCFSESAVLVRTDLERLALPTSYEGENLDFHALRHTFSHLLEAAGADDAQIGVLLGHAGKSVARNNYLSKNLNLFRGLVERMALPDHLTLAKCTISLPNKVIPLRAVPKAGAGSRSD